jgi:hypothetical protein
VRVAIIGTGPYPRAAIVQEANRAVADGHDVLALVGRPEEDADAGFDPAVEVRHDANALVRTRGSATVRKVFVKAPARLLRKLQVGPLHRPMGKVLSVYRSRISQRIEVPWNAADRALRARLQAAAAAASIAEWESGLVVLLNVEAIALADGFAPWLEEHGAVVAFAYADPVAAQ